MKSIILLALFCTLSGALTSQVVINEILPSDGVELKNLGTTAVDVSGYWLCNFPDYQSIGNLTTVCGNTMMMPGELLTVSGFSVPTGDAELGLYTSNSFSSSTAMIDYVEWGSTGHQRSSVAVQAGIWTAGDFLQAIPAGNSIEYSGTGESPTDWALASTPSLCAENANAQGCTAVGGQLTGGPFEFCVDGNSDFVSGVQLSGNMGSNTQWVVTDESLTILGLPPSPDLVDFDEAGAGVCLIWSISYEDGLVGLDVNANAANLDGCFELSNSIVVNRTTAVGGTLSGGPFSFCVDGIADMVSGVSVSGNEGDSSQWVITDANGLILGLPPTPDVVDFDGAGAGVCLIWHLSYNSGLLGLDAQNNVSDLVGCYDFSNSITVNRTEEMNVGGTLTGGDFTFCIDDEADFVSGVTVSGNEGANFAWVITDENLNILGLPPTPDVVDFNDAPGGVCQIWNISYSDGLLGLAEGGNVSDLQGCFALSNSISVTRQLNVGGILQDLNILGLPPSPDVVDFDEAGTGICYIWHLAYSDSLMGLAAGENAANLLGCRSLSGPIEVVRVDSGPACPNGINEVEAVARFELYPNPATRAITVSYDQLNGENAHIQLLDVSGREVKTILLRRITVAD